MEIGCGGIVPRFIFVLQAVMRAKTLESLYFTIIDHHEIQCVTHEIINCMQFTSTLNSNMIS